MENVYFCFLMSNKVIAIDIDGTLSHSDKTVSDFTVETLIGLQRQGHCLVLASGRPVYGLEPLAARLLLSEFGGYIIANNGASVIDCKTGAIMFNRTLEFSLVSELYEFSRSSEYAILRYSGNNVISEDVDNEFVKLACRINRMEPMCVDDFVSSLSVPVNKCIVVGAPDDIVRLEGKMSEKFVGRVGVFRSSPVFLELVPIGVDKSVALDVIVKDIGAEKSSVIAFGDSYNDIQMIRYAGVGVAMKNADDEVKVNADIIAPSNDDDGVAVTLLKLLGV